MQGLPRELLLLVAEFTPLPRIARGLSLTARERRRILNKLHRPAPADDRQLSLAWALLAGADSFRMQAAALRAGLHVSSVGIERMSAPGLHLHPLRAERPDPDTCFALWAREPAPLHLRNHNALLVCAERGDLALVQRGLEAYFKRTVGPCFRTLQRLLEFHPKRDQSMRLLVQIAFAGIISEGRTLELLRRHDIEIEIDKEIET